MKNQYKVRDDRVMCKRAIQNRKNGNMPIHPSWSLPWSVFCGPEYKFDIQFYATRTQARKACKQLNRKTNNA